MLRAEERDEDAADCSIADSNGPSRLDSVSVKRRTGLGLGSVLLGLLAHGQFVLLNKGAFGSVCF